LLKMLFSIPPVIPSPLGRKRENGDGVVGAVHEPPP